jgi:acetyl-CoA C-acetyltransferase
MGLFGKKKFNKNVTRDNIFLKDYAIKCNGLVFYVENNEAVKKELNIPDEIFNVNGGAIALGHPIGCSGARVMTTLVHALQDRNKEVGCGTLCLGGGNAVTMIVRKW